MRSMEISATHCNLLFSCSVFVGYGVLCKIYALIVSQHAVLVELCKTRLTDTLYRKMFIGGLNWETTDRE